MSRKRRKNKSKPVPQAPPAPPRYVVGSEVRVRPGTRDPDFPEFPLGGWTGTVVDIDPEQRPPTYLVEWNQQTREQMHPVFRKRCQRDDLDPDQMWLEETDLEPGAGPPAPIEQPAQIVTPPLRMSEQDDRVRAVFGLTSDDPLPPADEETLATYHRYLSQHLALPFDARVILFTGPLEAAQYRCRVVALLDPEQCDLDEGLLCAAEQGGVPAELPLGDLEVIGSKQNRRLVEDYAYWFNNAPSEEIEESEGAGEWSDSGEPSPAEPTGHLFLKYFGTFAGLGATCGAVVGAAVARAEGAQWGAIVGAALLALLGAFVGQLIYIDPAMRRSRRNWAGMLIGFGLGGALGALAGAGLVMAVAEPWGAVVGAVVLAALARWWSGRPSGTFWLVFGGLVGAVLGAVAVGVARDVGAAAAGAGWGALIGAGTGMAYGVLLMVAMTVTMWNSPER